MTAGAFLVDQLGRLGRPNVQHLQLGRRVDVFASARGEVVQNDHPVAPVDQGICDVRTDKSGTPGDEGGFGVVLVVHLGSRMLR